MTTGRLLALILITMMLVVLPYQGCNTKRDKVITIGAILPLTGRLSTMGEVERNAMSLALDKVNAGSKRLEIYFEDSKGGATDAVSAARKLLDVNNVDILLTSTTGASIAVEPIATERKKNLIAFCMDPDVAAKSDYVIRYYEGVEEEASAIKQYFEEASSPKTIGFLYANVAAYEKVVKNNLIPFLQSKNIPIPYAESYPINSQDFNAVVLKMKNSKITHLILLGYGFEYPSIFKPMVEYDFRSQLQILGGWGFLYTEVDPKLLEGVFVSGPEFVFRNQESANQFQSDYKTKYGGYPNFDAAFAYNVIMSLAENLKKPDLERPIKHLFTEKGSFSGVLGPYTFSQDGNMIVKTALGQYKDGIIVEKLKSRGTSP